jgi:hypothetical protein
MTILTEIGEELAATMPDVSQHAIEEHEAQQRENHASGDSSVRNPTLQPVDKNGKAYNPDTHEISPLTGKAIKKRRGGTTAKKSVIGGSTNASSKQSVADSSPSVDDGVAKARATGQFAAAATVAVCVGIFGDEFQPIKNSEKDEFAYLENAYANYFLATGKTDLPPSMALIVAIGMYAAPRLTQPKTKTKLGGFKDWAASKFLAWRGKKALKNAEKQADKASAE